MKIGILGTGVVGQSLGLGFAGRGHEVMMGSRDPGSDKVREWAAKAGGRASAGTFAQAAAFGEIAVLATAWSGTESALQLAGAENLAGKVVIDVTNPLDFSTGAPRLALGFGDSGGEQVQRWLPGAKVVKAFNIITAGEMVDPDFPCGPPTMFICGNDDGAKHAVAGICTDFGWEIVETGGIDGARLLEPLAMLWIVHGIRTGAWTHAFKLLRK
ncbi:NADPH-dependent F420 reductase [Longimicrobium sp.]|uniref:NADPH-dependent F420 reductase n=1 Tax=Longimicrobium sp. TaxID=2029185 RepID=UPI002BBB269F|nr:NAD(P)-binding domain-containing protein [Longimicrobium sp.]HSU16388.1 NAD(P)-binding domain-containing protein [Longimicrobium sp.]